MLRPLTPKQEEFFDFYRSYFKENGYVPSYNSIVDHLDLRHKNSVTQHLKWLKKKGYLTDTGIPFDVAKTCCPTCGQIVDHSKNLDAK